MAAEDRRRPAVRTTIRRNGRNGSLENLLRGHRRFFGHKHSQPQTVEAQGHCYESKPSSRWQASGAFRLIEFGGKQDMTVRQRHRTSKRDGRTDLSPFYRLSSPRNDRSMFAWSAPMGIIPKFRSVPIRHVAVCCVSAAGCGSSWEFLSARSGRPAHRTAKHFLL